MENKNNATASFSERNKKSFHRLFILIGTISMLMTAAPVVNTGIDEFHNFTGVHDVASPLGDQVDHNVIAASAGLAITVFCFGCSYYVSKDDSTGIETTHVQGQFRLDPGMFAKLQANKRPSGAEIAEALNKCESGLQELLRYVWADGYGSAIDIKKVRLSFEGSEFTIEISADISKHQHGLVYELIKKAIQVVADKAAHATEIASRDSIEWNEGVKPAVDMEVKVAREKGPKELVRLIRNSIITVKVEPSSSADT